MTDEVKISEDQSKAPESGSPAPKRQESAPSEPSMASRAARWAFRMLVVILLGIALGAGIYFGGRTVYRDAIEPLQTMDQRMRAIENEVIDLNQGVQNDKRDITEEISDLQGRVAAQAEEAASLDAQISRLELQIEDQANALEEMEEIRAALNTLEEDLGATEGQLLALEELIQAGELPAERIEENLQLMRVMNLMTRSRLWIEQDNYGLASEDIEAALGIMRILTETQITEDDSESLLLDIADQLTLALEVVRTDPSLAEEELETGWKLLIEATAP
jgi:chromosome segregation ATPase